MSQKLVLSVDDNKIQMQDLEIFVNRMALLKFGPRTEIEVAHGGDGKFLFTVPIPENAPIMVNGKRVIKATPTKVQKAVAKQIADRKEAVANGEEVPGSVAPLIKTVVKKIKCPICNSLKPLTRAGVIKHHVVGGAKCPGSGLTAPIAKIGRSITRATHGKANLSKGQKAKIEAEDKKAIAVLDVDPENTADNSPMGKQGKAKIAKVKDALGVSSKDEATKKDSGFSSSRNSVVKTSSKKKIARKAK